MSIPTLALFARSLRLESRQLRFYLARLGLLIVTLFGLMFAHGMSAFLGAPGLRFFTSIVYIDAVFICLGAASYFAAAISEEKEEITLGLLRMTSLSPVSILLGKSTSRMLGMVMFLLAQFPFTLLAITLGGVGLNQIVAAYCTLIAFMVLSSSLALFFSVMCRRSVAAGAWTFLILVGFPILCAILRASGVWVPAWFYELSTNFNLERIMTTGFADHPISYQVIAHLVLSGVFFLLSWVIFNLFTREQKQATPLRGLVFRRTSRLRHLGARRAWSCPFIWKDFHFIAGGIPGIIIRFIAYFVIILVMALIASNVAYSFDTEALGFAIIWIAGAGLFLESCFLASKVFKEEVKWRTHAIIMITPRSMLSLAFQKVAGCVIALIPAAIYFIVGALLVSESLEWVMTGVIIAIPGWISFLYLVAFFSLVVKRGGLALSFLIGYFVYSYAYGFIIFFGLGSRIMGGGSGSMAGAIVLAYVVFLGSAVALHFATWAMLKKAAAQ